MKTILVTGSTDGIGKLTAIALAKNGNRILLHGRNPKKLEKTITELKEAANHENIIGFVSDLSDFESIRHMVGEISKEVSAIDVLINNAGIYVSPNRVNSNQLDMRFAVNYFAPYLLTYGLIPLLEKSSAPRIINLSSAAQSPVSFNALMGKELLTEQKAYAQSKLALTMWSFYLAKTKKSLNVIAVNPGSLLNTKMAQEAFGQHWSPASKGVEILCDLALSDVYNQSSGQYFDNDKGSFGNAHPDAYDEGKITQLISETNKILGIRP
ncbi:SDR family NAD(P)-dependent oxidoreductase [Flagellimonas marinaquae]|uniref:SDR family NAD(P)-dependent oxidoreductase n=1 Tax=Flagellimonas marinaquae TaxID=254955 RepID=UPI0020760698|nr:SDR family NAD(P)-dependent oxidoreductase [Allomuricauda aquimarina]USD25125.1 SDR family NAD(P)-dependent oxidoreductase [Allomuricauda aquimarina]